MKDIKKKKLITQLHHIWNSGEMELIAVEQWCLSDDVSTLLTLGLLEEAPNF